jgi:hypothetical protein
MKKSVVSMIAVSLLAFSVMESQASVVFYDSFSYSDGALTNVSGGNWKETAAAANPQQVVGGNAVLGTSGQDTYSALSTPLTLVDGSTFYIGATVSFASAQAAGDYFLHFSSPAGTSTFFQERIFAKSTTGGLLLGFADNSGGTTAYGTTVLSLASSYNIILAYTSVAGALNDTFAMYVNPTDLLVEGNNTAYLTTGYIGTGAELTSVAALNLRQGTAANAPAETIDYLVAGTTFADVTAAPVPEPATLAIASLGGLACLVAMRRKR